MVDHSENVPEAVVGKVGADLSCRFWKFNKEKGEIEETTTVTMEARGAYAGLVNGFWFVRDRKSQVQLESHISQCVESCSQLPKAELERAPLTQEAQQQIKAIDYLEWTIRLFERRALNPSEQFVHEDFMTFRNLACRNEHVVRDIANTLSGIRMNDCHISTERWYEAAMKLRAFRSFPEFEHLLKYTQEALPKMVSQEEQQMYMNFVGELDSGSDDVSILVGLHGFKRLQSNPIQADIIAFASQILVTISTVASLKLCPALFLYIYIFCICVGFS